MAKPKEKIKARKLRQKGKSIKEIARKLNVSRSSVSLWCRDIRLTEKQIQRLHDKMISASYRGSLKGARIQHEKKLKRVKKLKKKGGARIKKLSDRDFLIAGVALYWAEGFKKGNKLGICNSDPRMIQFMIEWFKRVLGIENNRFTLHVGINEIHKNRIEEVEKYWSRITRIPKKQFTKTTLIKVSNKKIYKNFRNHYGTLAVRIKRPSEFKSQVIGMIEKLER